MDLQYFLNILWRRKWLILIAMIVPAVATYFFLDQQDEKYRASSILAYSAGTVDVTGIDLDKDNPFIQKFQLEAGFESLKTLMNSRPSVNMLTYMLLVHDLGGEHPPFREPNEESELLYTQAEFDNLVDIMKVRLEDLKVYTENDTLDFMIDEIAKAYGYDYKTITEDHLIIDRTGETATMKIEFAAEHPELVAFAVNEFSDKFKEYRFNLITSKDRTQVEFQQSLRDEFERDLRTKTNQLDRYKRDHQIVDLDAESKSIVSQISEIEMQLEDERRKIPALRASIENYNKYLKGIGTESATNMANKDINDLKTRPKIINLQKQLNLYNKQLIDKGGEDEKLESLIRSIRTALHEEVKKDATMDSTKDDFEKSEDKKDSKENNLTDKRINAEAELLLAQEGEKSLEKELERLYKRKASLVSVEAFLDNMEGEREIALGQYTSSINSFSELEEAYLGTTDPLNIIEYARVPEEADSKNKSLFSAFSGVVGGALTTLFIFLLAFFDNSLSNPDKFSKFTDMGLLGTLNKVKNKNLDVKALYHSTSKDPKLNTFRESVRNLRYILENSKDSTFLFTSTKEDEGKTFVLLNLAHSLQLKNKSIILVDTNFKDNDLTTMSNGKGNPEMEELISEFQLGEVFQSGKTNNAYNIDNVEVIRSKGTNLSPSEIFAGKDFHAFLDRLTLKYDYVFMEGPALNTYTDTKELVAYTDKVVAIFASTSDLKSADRNSINFLKGLDHKFLGAVLNKIDLRDLN